MSGLRNISRLTMPHYSANCSHGPDVPSVGFMQLSKAGSVCELPASTPPIPTEVTHHIFDMNETGGAFPDAFLAD